MAFPFLVLGFIGLVKQWVPAVVVAGVGLFSCWLLTREGRGMEYRQMSEDILVSPAGGRVVALDCLRPLGIGRLVIESGWSDPVYRIAPADGRWDAGKLKTDIGEIGLSFGEAAVVVDAGHRSEVQRGDTLAAVKWGGLTTVEFPLQNVEILKDFGYKVVIGEPLARHTSVWK